MPGSDDRVRELYALPPGEFTEARNRLAKDLRDHGSADDAVRVRSLRRPTMAAWALNRAARAEPRLVEELFAAGDALRTVQSRGAGSAELKGASQARRRAVERLVEAARAALPTSGDAQEEEITQTLLAAATDADVRELLRTGTLERASTPSTTFEDLGALLGASLERPRTRAKGTSARASATPPARDERALARAGVRARELSAAADGAGAEADRLRAEAADARRNAERLRRDAGKADRQAEEAERRANRARRKADDARKKADDAAAVLAELGGP